MQTENLFNLKIHKLSQEQYDRELVAGTLDEHALYITPDESSGGIGGGGFSSVQAGASIITADDSEGVLVIGSSDGSIAVGINSATGGIDLTADVPAASTSTAGIVQLSSATNSTSTTLAATASAVKAAYDKAVEAANNAGGGYDTTASGSYSKAEGYRTTAVGNYSSIEGYSSNQAANEVSGLTSTTADSTITTAWNNLTTNKFSLAKGEQSHVEGRDCLALGSTTHAEGFRTIASGSTSHTEGATTKANGSSSHAEGLLTIADADYTHAEGFGSTAYGVASHAGGYYTTTSDYQYAIGKCNVSTTGGSTSATTSGTALVIGNGGGNAPMVSRSNAFRITYAGEAYAKAAYNSTGADYAEFFEWLDSNPTNDDRRGYFVTLDGDKIKVAKPGDYILGIISGQPAMIGNSDENWCGRYIMDDFGAFIMEDFEYEEEIPEEVTEEVFDEETQETKTVITTVMKTFTRKGTKYKENPEYDPSTEYIQRADRPEWDAVGMMGVLSVRDDGTCQVNGYCTVAEGGTATASDSGYRVIKRVNDHIVKVIFR